MSIGSILMEGGGGKEDKIGKKEKKKREGIGGRKKFPEKIKVC